MGETISLVDTRAQPGWFRSQRLKLCFVMLFALPLAVLFFQDFAVHRPQAGWQLKSGRVTRREMAKTALGIKRPLLSVRIDGTDQSVQASLASNAINDLPERVTFYYSGDPAREVFLQEETNPLGIGLFLLLGPLFAWWLIGRFMQSSAPHSSSKP
ncbi:MAG TPA: hypothetical protein VG734_21310 [Lacunisphaera sp.]|nr:hypothetical protein [Lacunisphaera sp.]